MNQPASSEPSTRLKPVIGDTKLKAVTETCYLCRRLLSAANQVENRIRARRIAFGRLPERVGGVALHCKIWLPQCGKAPVHHIQVTCGVNIPTQVLQRTLIFEVDSTGREILNYNTSTPSVLGEERGG